MLYTHAQASERMQSLERVLPRFERRHHLAITIAIVLIDAVLLWFAFWSAYELRYGFRFGGDIFPWDLQSFSAFYGRAGMFVGFCLISFVLRGVYRLPAWTTLLDEMMLVAGSITVAMGVLVLTNYLSQFSPSRLVFVYAWILGIVYLMAVRVLRRGVRKALWTRSVGVERVLIVGSGEAGRRIVQAVVAAPDAGLRIAGFVDDPGQQRILQIGSRQGVVSPPRLGGFADVPAVVSRYRIDQVIIAVEDGNHRQVSAISDVCSASGVRFHVVPDLLQLSFERAELSELAGVPLLGVRQASITGSSATAKRVFDLVLVAPLLLLSMIPLGIVWLKSRDRGQPLLRRNERVGRNGRLYDQLGLSAELQAAKAEENGLPPAHRQSGLAWLLDSIPLLINVARGDLSLIGPLAPKRADLVHYQDWHLQRLRTTPGLTGLWAVQGRDDLTFDEMVRLDLFYAEHWSLWLDVKILLRAMPRLWGNLYGR